MVWYRIDVLVNSDSVAPQIFLGSKARLAALYVAKEGLVTFFVATVLLSTRASNEENPSLTSVGQKSRIDVYISRRADQV